MREQIRSAFEEIHAEETLKAKTRAAVRAKAEKQVRRTGNTRRLAAVLACLVLMLLGARRLYLTPTVVISLDINPSVELAVNGFDRVITATGMNPDGEALLQTLSLENRSCGDAVEQLLNSETIKTLLAEEEFLEIGIVGSGGAQDERLLSVMGERTGRCGNVSCYAADRTELEAAHALGMSCGKYRAYAVLQEQGTDLRPEEAQNMTMRQLRELAGETLTGLPATAAGQNHPGQGAGYGARWGKNGQ